ncbi:NAD-dependent protein deacylase Sirt4-like [Ornithodoros turicata]|uniref:NAD-dependent protein deacylase Sirt4-like n=1 Tax=Ornithodoros turicata TaxID=34597 RepID=UPI003138C038
MNFRQSSARIRSRITLTILLPKPMSLLTVSCVTQPNILRSHLQVRLFQYVPKHKPCSKEDIEKLQDFVSRKKNLLVLTGAGISTESNIPDYRSEGVGLYSRNTYRPVSYKTFTTSAKARQRYWARNFVGWPRFSAAEPNITHRTLAEWEKNGRISLLVTQNVDGLHRKAGSKLLTELHGTSFVVKCLSCSVTMSRHEFQKILHKMNPYLDLEVAEIRPDGDVHLDGKLVDNFSYPDCQCGGILKPDVVFFGDNVPLERVRYVYDKLDESDGLLILGSSLEVYSAYRFPLKAVEIAKPTMIVNIGPTRADRLPGVTNISARCGEILPDVIL